MSLDVDKNAGDVLDFIRLSEKVIIYIVIVIAVLVTFFLWSSSYAKKIHLQGSVISEKGLFNVVALNEGYVTAIYVSNSDLVKVGQPLFSINKNPQFNNENNIASENSFSNNAKVITAPIDGEIARIAVSTNQYVVPNTQGIVIIPKNNSWIIQLLAASQNIGSLTRGKKVLIKYSAYPSEQYGVQTGEIISVSKTPKKIIENESFYEINVKPDSQCVSNKNDCYELKDGLTLSAIIEGDRRSLLQWLFSPIL